MNNPKIDNSICSKRKIDITLKLYSVAVFFKFNGLVNFFLLFECSFIELEVSKPFSIYVASSFSFCQGSLAHIWFLLMGWDPLLSWLSPTLAPLLLATSLWEQDQVPGTWIDSG